MAILRGLQEAQEESVSIGRGWPSVWPLPMPPVASCSKGHVVLQTLSSRPVLKNRYLIVNRESVRTSSGQIFNNYYIAEKTDFVMVLAITEAGEVIIVREWKQGVRAYVWNLPAGGVEEGEPPRKAAERELLEETGYSAEEFRLLGNHWHVSSSWLKDRAYLFYAPDAVKVAEPFTETTEDIEVHLVPFGEVVEMVRSGRIADPYTALAVLWVERELG